MLYYVNQSKMLNIIVNKNLVSLEIIACQTESFFNFFNIIEIEIEIYFVKTFREQEIFDIPAEYSVESIIFKYFLVCVPDFVPTIFFLILRSKYNCWKSFTQQSDKVNYQLAVFHYPVPFVSVVFNYELFHKLLLHKVNESGTCYKHILCFFKLRRMFCI